MKDDYYIGTSGWSYDHWGKVFYPQGMSKEERLRYYTRFFNTVEINNTFYHLPTIKAFEGWRESNSKGFIFSLKASRFITHMKKLKEPKESLGLFLKRAKILKDKLGPILFQLPPHWKCNVDRLMCFLSVLPPSLMHVFEFRDESWFNNNVYALLEEKNASLCIYHMPGFLSPIKITADFVYMRFHGTESLYGGKYSKSELVRWRDMIKEFAKKGLDVYAYFNNDAYGYAIENALELKRMLK
ncbi:MAG: DUF72 domain-containing protein [Candidatus Scalinduaceae bacterium]